MAKVKVSQEVNEIFSPLWQETNWRYAILMGGRGAGRSTAGSQYVLSKLLAPDFFRCAIMRAVQGDIRQSIWREISDRITEQNIKEALHIVDSDMRIEYGQNTVQAHGFKASSGSLTARLKSLANYNTVVIEEAEEIGEHEFMTLDDTLRTIKGDIRIVLMLNPPPKNHWIIERWFDLKESEVKGFFIPSLKKDAENTIFLPGSFRDNISNLDDNTLKRYQAYKQTKPDYYWQMIEGLVPESARGKIYHGWELIDDVPKEARLVRFGIDFGWFPDSAAVVAIYYLNGGYIIDEVAYGIELTNEYLAGEMKAVGSALAVGDSAEPKSIDELKRLGVKAEGAEKGKDSVNYGIKQVSEKKIAVTRRSENVWKEYENYAWDEDKDGNPKNIPAHTYSHSMDAIRYAIVSLGGSNTGNSVKVNKPQFRSYGHVGKGVSVNKPMKLY